MTAASAAFSHCQGTRKDGLACRAVFDLSAEGYCLLHDPLRQDDARAKRAKAGIRAGRPKERLRFPKPEDLPTPEPPKTLEEVKTWASWLVFQMTIGTLEASYGREANKALQTLSLRLEREAGLEKRIRELEKKLGKQADTRGE